MSELVDKYGIIEWEKLYLDCIPIEKFTYVYHSFKERQMHSIGSFCSIGINQRLS